MRVRLGLCGLVMVVACGTQLTFTRSDTAQRSTQPRGPAQVEMFTKGRPERPNVEIGSIEAKPSSTSERDRGELVEKMREYAGELGCDALVIPAADPSSTLEIYRGACLVYTAPPLLQPPPTAAPGSSANACIPNTPQPCYGQGGCRGNQVCSADGKSFSACDCAAPSAQ